MAAPSTFAKRVFQIAGIYGIIVLLPQYFLEERLNRDYPPPITHPEHFYGFIGGALAWQIVFLVIARDVHRFRPLMLAGVLEKLTFGIAAIVLFLQDRIPVPVLVFATIDLILGALFLAAYRATAAPVGDER